MPFPSWSQEPLCAFSFLVVQLPAKDPVEKVEAQGGDADGRDISLKKPRFPGLGITA